ncbi:MAG: PQQ-binding-like beta-propeller repeat protein [Halobacteriales archaeon]
MVPLGRRTVLRAGAAGIGLGLAGCLGLGESPRWPSFRNGGSNAGGTRAAPGGDLAVGWERDLASTFEVPAQAVTASSSVADEARAYVAARLEAEGATGTGVLAFDPADGSVDWRRQLEHDLPEARPLVHPPIVAEEFVFVVAGDRGVAFDRETGRTHLEFDLPWVPTTAPGGDRYLIALGGDLVSLVDLEETEGVRWDRAGDGSRIDPISPITVIEDRMYVPVGGRLMTLRRGDGITLREDALPRDGTAAAPPQVDGLFLHLRVTRADGADELVAWRRDNRAVEWHEPLSAASDGAVTTDVLHGGKRYVPDGSDLVALFVGSGERDWRRDVGVHARYPTVGGESVYLLGDDQLVVVDRQDGAVRGEVDLPGSPAPTPVEAVPRAQALLVTRDDRLLGLAE